MSVSTKAPSRSLTRDNNRALSKKIILRTLAYLSLLLACFIALLPIVSAFTVSFKTAEDGLAPGRVRSLLRTWIEPEMQADPFIRPVEIHMACVTVRIMGSEIDASLVRNLRDERCQDHPRIHAVIALAGILRLDVTML